MKLINNKKGNAVLHIGAGTIFLILLVLFIVISLVDPALGKEITTTIIGLATAIKGG